VTSKRTLIIASVALVAAVIGVACGGQEELSIGSSTHAICEDGTPDGFCTTLPPWCQDGEACEVPSWCVGTGWDNYCVWACDGESKKCTVCHLNNGIRENVLIDISQNAVITHFEHGDTPGVCL